jgi:hypothetical protein
VLPHHGRDGWMILGARCLRVAGADGFPVIVTPHQRAVPRQVDNVEARQLLFTPRAGVQPARVNLVRKLLHVAPWRKR